MVLFLVGDIPQATKLLCVQCVALYGMSLHCMWMKSLVKVALRALRIRCLQ